MQDSNPKDKQPEYNQEEVFFCAHCLSLKIRNAGQDLDYCDECGSTEIEKTNIENWEEKYKSRYGHSFLETY